jgi:hypothetical protein
MVQIIVKIDGKEFTSPQAAKNFIDKIFSIKKVEQLSGLDIALQQAQSDEVSKPMSLKEAISHINT